MLQVCSQEHIIKISDDKVFNTSPMMVNNEFDVIWRNLSYSIGSNSCFKFGAQLRSKDTYKFILKNLNGSFKSGQMMAIMGPSGSGKTTLLECLAGKKQTGVSGDIFYSGKESVKLSFISQHDQILSHLTVREALMFASKLKNVTKQEQSRSRTNMALDIVPCQNLKMSTIPEQKSNQEKINHELIVNTLLEQLGLDKCVDVKVSKCSGGQIKRLSIAQELVSKPNILILDEPTSGLDSASCFQCIEHLLKVCQSNTDHPIAIVSTIHQPSARVFGMFHKIYFLSIHGQCIYEGQPAQILDYCASVGLNCPTFHNPADYATEIASGDYGMDYNYKLQELTCKNFENESMIALECENYQPIRKKIEQNTKFPIFHHTRVIFHRTMLSIIRNPVLFTLRLVSHIIVALFIGFLYGNKIGNAGGCPPPSNDLNSFISIQNELYKDLVSTSENIANFFFANMFVMFGALMPTVLTFPMEMNVFLKEKSNNWYSCGIYYTAKTLADVPFQIFFPALYGTILYFMHSQIWSYWRFSMFISLLVLVALTAQSQGLLISALFINNATAAVFIAPILAIPALLFAGFFVRIKTMPYYFVPLTYISYIRYGFESLIAVTYGFGRCIYYPYEMSTSTNQTRNSLLNLASLLFPQYTDDYDDEGDITNSTIPNPAMGLIEKFFQEMQFSNPFISDIIATQDNQTSYVLTQYQITDDSLYTNIIRLFICFIILRLGAYFALLWKANQKK